MNGASRPSAVAQWERRQGGWSPATARQGLHGDGPATRRGGAARLDDGAAAAGHGAAQGRGGGARPGRRRDRNPGRPGRANRPPAAV
ncbi:hypothetical protein ACFC13_40455, partial [Streptomyces sp. NPDC056081]